MNPIRLFFLSAVVGIVAESSVAQDFRSRLKGLVYEAEDWTTPESAWVKDQYPPDKWCLWTKEEDVARKRSGGQSLKSPDVREDRQRPEDGAPVLHTLITDIPVGLYHVWMNNPARRIALSFDGATWAPYQARGELDLGLCRIEDGRFELWVDDRYALPESPGSCYFDYLRFEAIEEPALSHFQAFTLPDGRTQLTWITSVAISSGIVELSTPGGPVQSIPAGQKSARNHIVVLPQLESGKPYTACVRILSGEAEIAHSAPLSFVAGERPVPPSTRPREIPLTVAEPTSAARQSWPVTSGIPFARGMLASATDVVLLDGAEKRRPAQCEVLSRWDDGSVRWLLLDTQVDTVPGIPQNLLLRTESDREVSGDEQRIARRVDGGIVLDTGAMICRIAADDAKLYKIEKGPGGVDIPAPESWLVLADGTECPMGQPDLLEIEVNGPLRAVVRAEGGFRKPDGQATFRYRFRISVYRDKAFLRIRWTLGNDRIDELFTQLDSAGIRFPLPTETGTVTADMGAGAPIPLAAGQSLRLLQDYDDHFSLQAPAETIAGTRYDGALSIAAGDTCLSLITRDFWQTYPKGYRIAPEALNVDLLPKLPGDQYANENDRTDERQIALFYWCRDGKYLFKRGMEATGEIMVSAGAAEKDRAVSVEHVNLPLFAQAPPSYMCETGAFWDVQLRTDGEFPRYWKAFYASFANLEKGRTERHEYGWMNYGDWWGERAWNWGNSEYDLPYVCAVHFAQTGDLDLLRRGDQMARHNTSVDVVHYPWQENLRELVYAHSVGHVGGFFEKDDPRITNKVYSMVGFISGARDGSGGHTFQGGNFLYGFLTGDRRYLEVAETVCRNQAQTYTPKWNFGIERAAGWSLYNALSAYESTLNPYFLNAARIYLEKIYELQDPETGGWRMPQGPPECDCPDAPHIGGKAFATGVLLHALIMADRVQPDAEVEKSIVRGADWLLDCSWNENKQGFRYKTGCPKYANHGWYTTLVTEGIAYAYQLTGNTRYRDFLVRTLPVPLGKTTGSGRSCGKDFASNFRHLPHTLSHLKRWGVSHLDPPPPPLVFHLRQALLPDDDGGAELVVYVCNPRKETVSCQAEIRDLPDSWSVSPRNLQWEAQPGTHASPVFAFTGLTSTSAAGPVLSYGPVGEPMKQVEIQVATMTSIVPNGNAVGFIGPAEHYSLKALRECDIPAELIESPETADLTSFVGIVVGSDVLSGLGDRAKEVCRRLACFARGGGKVVFLQINDSDWSLDCLPYDVAASDENSALGKVTQTDHPLFAGIPDVKGTVCYDTLAFVGPEWKILARDTAGRPCIVEAEYGTGSLCIIEPSFDRWADAKPVDVGCPAENCRRFIGNLAGLLK